MIPLISEKDLNIIPEDTLQKLTNKYKLDFNPKERLKVFNQFLDLINAQVLDPTPHQILLDFFGELFQANPVFKSHTQQMNKKIALPKEDSFAPLEGYEISLVDLVREENLVEELIVLKRQYTMLSYKQLLALWIFNSIKTNPNLMTNPSIALAMEIAERSFKEKKYEQFASICSEIYGCCDKVINHRFVFYPLCASLAQLDTAKVTLSKVSQEQKEHAAKVQTPPAIIKLRNQGAFQKMCTMYCSAISALVATHIMIHHLTELHKQEGLLLEDLKKELFRLLSVNPAEFNSKDSAQDIINAFYFSDFYKNQINHKDYKGDFVVKGKINFEIGNSFNECIHTKQGYGKAGGGVHQAVEISQLHHLLNIALINLLNKKTSNIFRMAHTDLEDSRDDLIKTVTQSIGLWSGNLHVVVKLNDGSLINAPNHFPLQSVPAYTFVFQHVSLTDKFDLTHNVIQDDNLSSSEKLSVSEKKPPSVPEEKSPSVSEEKSPSVPEEKSPSMSEKEFPSVSNEKPHFSDKKQPPFVPVSDESSLSKTDKKKSSSVSEKKSPSVSSGEKSPSKPDKKQPVPDEPAHSITEEPSLTQDIPAQKPDPELSGKHSTAKEAEPDNKDKDPQSSKKDARLELVQELKVLLIDYQNKRLEKHKKSINQLVKLLDDYKLDGANENLLKTIEDYKSKFPGEGFSSTLNKMAVKLIDAEDPGFDDAVDIKALLEVHPHKEYIRQIAELYTSLDAMKNFADQLKNSKEQTVVSNLTEALRNDLDRFVSQHPKNVPSEESYLNFKYKFTLRLHSEDKLMHKHEHIWKPIVKNILIAIFTLGIVLGIQLIASKVATGKARFFGEKTDKERFRNDIEEVINKPRSR
jgi:hypothetical protein